MYKMILNRKAQALAALAMLSATAARAEGVAYFTMPADFSSNVQTTITGVAGVLLVALGLMFAWRKTVKSTNRS